MNVFALLYSLLLLALLTGCGTFPTTQSARVLEQGKMLPFVGIGAVGGHIPNIQGGMTIGLGHKWDVTGRLSLFGLSGAEGKFQFLDTEKFAAAVGLAAGYGGWNDDRDERDPVTGRTQRVASSATNSTTDLALYPIVSYQLMPQLEIFTSPRIIHRIRREGQIEYPDTLLKMNLGLKAGEKTGFFVEAGVTRSTRWQSDFGELNFAYFWSIQ